MKKFPKKLYVKIQSNENDKTSWFEAGNKPTDILFDVYEKAKLGVYELKEIVEAKVDLTVTRKMK